MISTIKEMHLSSALSASSYSESNDTTLPIGINLSNSLQINQMSISSSSYSDSGFNQNQMFDNIPYKNNSSYHISSDYDSRSNHHQIHHDSYSSLYHIIPNGIIFITINIIFIRNSHI